LKTYRSRFGLILAALYLIMAAVVIDQVYGCTDSSYVGCDLPLALVVLPALPMMLLLDKMGIWTVRFSSPGPHATDVILVILSVLFSVVIVYLVGLGLEMRRRLVRRRH
jgi:hypothetical protein